ncbi:MAG: hypothetical protein VB032_06485 [Burkholderiaceae bacterium]|nr:hypothetical protein [Burkholderiaceae bacterium]
MAFEIDITRIRTMITRNYEPVGMYILDMIYIADEPHVVFEWTQREDGQHIPVIFAPLDPEFLEELPPGGEVTHMYRMGVEDPRPAS